MDFTANVKKSLPTPAVQLITLGGGLSSPSPISRMDRLSTASTKSPSNSAGNDQNTGKENQTYFTPLLISSEQQSRMVILSPSRTISETLISLATSTGRQLEEIWDEVGYSPEERATELADLIAKFRESCEAKVVGEQHFAATYRQTIADAKDEVRRIAGALKFDLDPQILNGIPTQTLIDEHASLEATLEGLRTAAATAKEDMQDCLKFLIEAHDALGLDLETSWRDVVSDLTTHRREQFHSKKDEMKEELATRTAAVVQLVRDCQQLIEDLRMDPVKDGSELDRRIAGSLIRSEHGTYAMASNFRSETCVGISSKALEELTRHVAQLIGEKRRRKGLLQEMGAEIAVLWEKLRIPEDEQLAFTMSVQGLSIGTITKGEHELKRLRALKSEMLGNLVYEARETIKQLWEVTNIKPEDRRSFTAFFIRDENSFDDNLLETHEVCIQTLQTRMEQMRPILRLLERREVVLQERNQYEDLQKDPERLTQRGAALTKQLMAEEKMAIRIKRELPKLTEKLTEALNEWKGSHNEDFQWKGEVYTEVMIRQEEEWKNYKADEAHRKLKKKQEDLNFVENRFVPIAQQPVKKRPGAQPLGDSTSSSQNIVTSTTPTAAAMSNLSAGMNFKPRTHQSHDMSSSQQTSVPVRSLGEKQLSNRL
jgi:Ase1/PRC1/MAP65 family protein